MTKIFAISLALMGGTLALGAPVRADDRVIPADLGDGQKANLKKFLASREKPKQFLPEGAKVVGAPAEGVQLGTPQGAEVKEYLAAVVPHVAADRKKGPEKADIFWYRPNPNKGSPGVTIKRTIDLTTGEPVGPPQVLFNHATPLAPEERDEAVALARKQSRPVAELYNGAEEKDVEVAALVQVISAAGQPDGSPGDRVVSLQFHRKGTKQRAQVMVNLTKQTVRDPNNP
jgi:hypothetical protein